MSYAALKLDEMQRQKILAAVPVIYPKTICDHITLGRMSEATARKLYFNYSPKTIEIIGVAEDGNGIQTLVVQVNGTVIRPYDKEIFHITHSLNPEKDVPAEFDTLSLPGEEMPKFYKPVTSKIFLRAFFDIAGQRKETTRPEWTYIEFENPIAIQAHPVYTENKISRSLLTGSSSSIEQNRGPGGMA